MSKTLVSPFDTFLDVFAVPGNSVGIPVPAGVQCPLTAEGDKLLASYIRNLRQAGAPDAEIETVTALARHGHFKSWDDSNVDMDHTPYSPTSEYTNVDVSCWRVRNSFLRVKNCMRCFLGLIIELDEIPDRYGNLPSEGREWSIPQVPKMTVEVHCPHSDEDASDILVYEAAPEHPPSPPLRKLVSISLIANLTGDELDQYLKFYATDVSEDADRNTKLGLLMKELGIDCMGATELDVEALSENQSRAVALYLQLVRSQFTATEAPLVQYSKVQSDEEFASYPELDINGPCEMFRQQMFAVKVLEARFQNRLGPPKLLAGKLVEVPDSYGNVPSGGRNVHIPAQIESRTPVHIPEVDHVVRYVVLGAIPEHPIVEPLPALTRMTEVLDLTPDQANQYLKFYCVVVPKGADRDQRLALLKAELSIDHIGPAHIRRYPEELELLMGSTEQPLHKDGMSFASMGMDDMDVAEKKVVEKKVDTRTATKTNVNHSSPSRKKRRV